MSGEIRDKKCVENLRQKKRPTYSGAVSNKLKNISILSDCMLLDCKNFPGSKSQQLDHHSISILQEHEYDEAIIPAWINDLIKNPNENKDAAKIAKDVIDVALQCRNQNIGTEFISR